MKLNRVKEVEKTLGSIVEETKSNRFNNVVSTSSTLLDLAISGEKVYGGGIPGGIIMEIYGPPGTGKTAFLASICSSAQKKGGDIRLGDPEARLDQEYSEIYGLSLTGKYGKAYYRPDTVTELFDDLKRWEPKPEKKGAISVYGADSLAALSTHLELESEEGDKMGMRRAKEFSEGLRKICRKIVFYNILVCCTNQTRIDNKTTPGGKGIPFYSSLRIETSPKYGDDKIEKEIEVNGRKIKKIIGIKTTCFVSKSTIASPFRKCDVSIIFNYGIDSIRDELQFLKDIKRLTKYPAVKKEFQSIDRAIFYIEENNLQKELRDEVIKVWMEIEEKFKIHRRPRIWF